MCCNKHVLADKTHHSCLDYNWHIILCHLCLIAIHWNTQLIPRQIGYGYIWFFQIVLIWCIQFFISGPFLYFYKNIISSHILQTNRYDSGDNIESFFLSTTFQTSYSYSTCIIRWMMICLIIFFENFKLIVYYTSHRQLV